MKRLFAVCLLGLSVELTPGMLLPQHRDDIRVAFEVGVPPAPRTAALALPAPPPNGAAMTFRQARINIPDIVSDMRAVDLNKDGLTDIVVLDKKNKCLKVYLGDATLSFTKRYKYGFSQIGNLIIGVADFDGSGKPDVAVTSLNLAKPISIFFGRDDGRLIGSPLNLTPSARVYDELDSGSAVDLDGNGRPDILAEEMRLFSFLNLGKKKFKAMDFWPEADSGLAAADFDGDKKADCFMYGYDYPDRKIYFFKGLGDGTFIKRNGYKVGTTREGALYAADLTRDGKMDIFGQGGTDSGYGNNWVFPGRGNGTLGARKRLPGQGSLANGVAIADFNSDGIPDLAAAEGSGLWVYAGKGTGAFDPAAIQGDGLGFGERWSAKNGAQRIGWGHFNGDRRPDLIGVGGNMNSPFYNIIPFDDLIVFKNGLAPATLTLSNLAVTTLTHSTDRIAFAGSFDYAGTDCVFKYLPEESHPGKSAYITFGLRLDLPDPFSDISVSYMVAGPFLEGLNPDAGTIVLNLDLPSPISVTGFIPELRLTSFRMVDFNLVRSNIL